MITDRDGFNSTRVRLNHAEISAVSVSTRHSHTHDFPSTCTNQRTPEGRRKRWGDTRDHSLLNTFSGFDRLCHGVFRLIYRKSAPGRPTL